MKFELDDALINDILFHMENQNGKFYIDAQGYVINPKNESEGFIDLPEWTSNDGFRLMEKFTASLKNSAARKELSQALNVSKGVFRSFKKTIEKYPEIEKQWLFYKNQKMKERLTIWYNGLRAEWGLQPIGAEPEDTSSLVLEDFEIHKKKSCQDTYCFTAENQSREICAEICAVKNEGGLHIIKLEVKPQYRGLGLGKTLLAKLIEKNKNENITIDLPAKTAFFSRSLLLEGFKPVMQRFLLKPPCRQ